MDIRVAGHQVETGEALRTHVSDRITQLTEKYFARATSADVTFGRAEHNDFRCDIVAPVNKGIVLKASNKASDAHVAFEGAADKIERQLKRYRGRLNAHRGAQDSPEFDASYRVFESKGAIDEAEDRESDAPAIVAETRVDIPTASVSDAVMMLDLRDTNALMFKNGQTGAYNMVYRRQDGTIGWVEPGQ